MCVSWHCGSGWCAVAIGGALVAPGGILAPLSGVLRGIRSVARLLSYARESVTKRWVVLERFSIEKCIKIAWGIFRWKLSNVAMAMNSWLGIRVKIKKKCELNKVDNFNINILVCPVLCYIVASLYINLQGLSFVLIKCKLGIIPLIILSPGLIIL